MVDFDSFATDQQVQAVAEFIRKSVQEMGSNSVVKVTRKWSGLVRLNLGWSRQCRCRELFNLLKRERIRRMTYKAREEARQDVFDYIRMFYNQKRKHGETRCCRPSSSNGSGN